MKVHIDPESLTLGDLESFEDATGTNFEDAFAERPVLEPDGTPKRGPKGRPILAPKPSAKATLALVWIALRRDKPGMTLEDARAIRVTDLEIGSDAPNPKEMPA